MKRRRRQRIVAPLTRRRFARLVAKALADLPPDFQRTMENIAVVVEDEPLPEDLRLSGLGPDETLLGLYHGTPLTERTTQYGLTLPDRVVIYRWPICEACASEEEIVREVRRTVVHEVAHHFGIDDERLEALGWD